MEDNHRSQSMLVSIRIIRISILVCPNQPYPRDSWRSIKFLEMIMLIIEVKVRWEDFSTQGKHIIMTHEKY
jgi:hypothetical protein